MSDPTSSNPGPAPEMESLEDDTFGRRIGIALTVSIAANVLLLQGAGTLAKNMTVTNPSKPDITISLRSNPVKLETPPPTPTPEPSVEKPTPKPPKQKEKAVPTPTPKPPKEKPVATPTPKPEPEPSASPEPTPEPVPTPKPVITPKAATPPPPDVATPTPPPTEKTNQQQKATESRESVVQNLSNTPQAIQKAETAPAQAALTPRQASALQANNHAALGKIAPSGGIIAVKSRSSSAAPSPSDFVVSSSAVAPAPVVHELKAEHTDVIGTLSKAFTGAKPAEGGSAAAIVESDVSANTRQALTSSGTRRLSATGRVNVITDRSNAPTTAATFEVPAGGNVAPGAHIATQGASRTSTIAAMSGGPQVIAGAGENAAIVTAPGSAPTVGIIGNAGRRGQLSKIISNSPGTRAGSGAGTGAAGNFAGIGSGTGNARGSVGVAGGKGTGTFGASGGFGSGIQGSSNGLSAATGGTGSSGARIATGHGVGGKIIGKVAGGIGSGSGRESGPGGPAGVANGEVGGTGNGDRYAQGVRSGGSAIGVTNGSGSGNFRSGGEGIKATSGSVGGGATARVRFSTGDSEFTGKSAGSRVNPVMVGEPNVVIPEDLRRQKLSVRIEAKVTVQPGGQHRAEIVHGSGYPALDNAVIAALNATRFKPATVDGNPVEATIAVPITISQN